MLFIHTADVVVSVNIFCLFFVRAHYKYDRLGHRSYLRTHRIYL
jgi:hypothetical protein